jgi:hypothetical protein
MACGYADPGQRQDKGNPSHATADNRIHMRELIPAIVDRPPVILVEVGELLAEQQPDYAGFLAGDFEEILDASEEFITRLIGLALRDPSTSAPQLASGIELALLEQIGRIRYQQRREISRLLAAYRTGAAVAWRYVSDTALRLGVPAEMFAGLAAVIFAAVDQLSSASLRCYAHAQTTNAGQARERLREKFSELLLSDRCDTTTIRAAAARVGWPLPRQAAVVLINPDNEVGPTLLTVRARHRRRPHRSLNAANLESSSRTAPRPDPYHSVECRAEVTPK